MAGPSMPPGARVGQARSLKAEESRKRLEASGYSGLV